MKRQPNQARRGSRKRLKKFPDSANAAKHSPREVLPDRQAVEKIFLKMPPRRRGLIGNLTLLSIALAIILFGLLAALYLRDYYHERQLAAIRASEANTTLPGESIEVPPDSLVEAVMHSTDDPEIISQLDAFFGKLPQTFSDPSYERHPVRGIYCRTPDNDLLDYFLKIAKTTEVNALIIDAKESYGLSYQSKVPLAVEIGASVGSLDWAEICRRCHAEGVLVIARVVVFKDEQMVNGRPDLCIRNTAKQVCKYPMEGGTSFVNPYNPEAWQYIIDICKELIAFGVDEIQFDYIRFPTGAPEGELDALFSENYSNEDLPERHWVINRFLETARIEIQDKLKVPLGADLFASIMLSDIDGFLLGQHWKSIGLTGIDNIGVMVYPSHFANSSLHYSGNGEGSQIGDTLFDKPDLEPYGVVKNTMLAGLDGFAQKGYATMRPYLQAFTANYLPPGYYIDYTDHEIREQMRALRDVGLREWQLWRPDPDYPLGSFRGPEAEVELTGPEPTVNRHQVTIPPATIP
ncbi:MAG: putative glycoside hydrolase [Eubacteriales bacterium]|nr:putative glycoside hydrolase [Eubacteriales bacterium]